MSAIKASDTAVYTFVGMAGEEVTVDREGVDAPFLVLRCILQEMAG